MTNSYQEEATRLAELTGTVVSEVLGSSGTAVLKKLLVPALVVVFERRDKFAALVHEQWMLWASSTIEFVPEEMKAGWEAMMVPYDQLSEDAKGWSRTFADRVIQIIDGADEL